MEKSLAASSSSSSSWWPSLILVTCLSTAIAFGSVNFRRRFFRFNNNDEDDDEAQVLPPQINAVAMDGFNINLGFGLHRVGVDLNLGYVHSQLRGSYPNVIFGSFPPAFIVSGFGADVASSSGGALPSDSAAVAEIEGSSPSDSAAAEAEIAK